MLRPRLRIPRAAPRFGSPTTSWSSSPFQRAASAQHSMHTLPELAYPFSNQESPLLSEKGFYIAWNQYQSFVLDRLNERTVGTDWESKDVKATLLGTARDPGTAGIFNYASMAHNNHFFFRHLVSSSSSSEKKMPTNLERHINTSFGSVATLREEMIKTARAMFGPGFVWLVRVDQPGVQTMFKVVPTYLAGSPYPGAHWRRQEVDLNTAVGSTPEGIETAKKYLANSAYGTGNPSAGQSADVRRRVAFAPGGTDLVPVLCVNTWEHVYMYDYGVAGKDEFVENWWDHVDWKLVAQEANLPDKGLSA
ncbi:Manganese/iron superoxide dismutase [Echria macrotheca]|uniref:Manganese/iron superoxide dismutase n=1 Tax=Echria macrotheca TaxID=438768 RepID=A0AAJ0BCI7_9PEZI|nr:Manganese/iron superoxide dismutase [Echria macrotheca]